MGTVEQPPCCWCGQPGAWYSGSWPAEDGTESLPLAWCDADKPDWFIPFPTWFITHVEDDDDQGA